MCKPCMPATAYSSATEPSPIQHKWQQDHQSSINQEEIEIRHRNKLICFPHEVSHIPKKGTYIPVLCREQGRSRRALQERIVYRGYFGKVQIELPSPKGDGTQGLTRQLRQSSRPPVSQVRDFWRIVIGFKTIKTDKLAHTGSGAANQSQVEDGKGKPVRIKH